MSVKPCNIRIPSGLSDAQVAADAACAAKRYAYSAEQVESRLNSYVDDLTGLDLEQIAANTAAAAEVVERTEAAAATAQYSAEIVERLAPEVKDMLDTIVEQDLEQLRQDIEVATNLIATVDGKVSDAQQAATDARGSALQADQSETAAEAALAETWIAYSAVLDEKDSAAAHFAEEAVEKVAEAVTAQLNPGGDFYAALNTAVTDTIPSTVKAEADKYVTELTTEGGSLHDYVEDSKAEISSLQGGAVSTIITHREAALTAITTAKDEAIESIGEKVDKDIAEKINPEYISEKVNAVLPGLIDEELADENGAWNTAKNEAIADATDQAELARQWATSDTHVAGTSYSGAYGYMLITERLADAAAQSESTAVDAASRAAESSSAAYSSAGAAANSETNAAESANAAADSARAASISASEAADSETNAAGYAVRAESARDLAEQHVSYAGSLANAAYSSASAAANSESNAKASETAASNSAIAASGSASAAANSESNAKASETAASNSAEAAASSESNAADSENLAERYMEVAEAFAVSQYDSGFIINNTASGPVIEMAAPEQGYSSARTYAYSARDFASKAHSDAATAGRYMQMAYSWAALETTFSYNSNDAASARMWAEAEDPFQLNDEEHKSAKAYAKLAKTDEAEAYAWAQEANGAAADAATAYSNTVEAYEGTLNAYSGTLDAYNATKAAVGEAATYLTDVNAVKNTIDQTLISSNWTANNITVDDSGAFTVTPGLVYAVWSKEVCEIYKDAALENKLCTIWAEEQRCILATQETYYVSPVEQAASVIITSMQYTQPSA